jgi:hypothetical protein
MKTFTFDQLLLTLSSVKQLSLVHLIFRSGSHSLIIEDKFTSRSGRLGTLVGR